MFGENWGVSAGQGAAERAHAPLRLLALVRMSAELPSTFPYAKSADAS